MNKRIKFALFEMVPSFLIWVITVFALDRLIEDPDIRGLAVVIVLVGVSIWGKLSMILTTLLGHRLSAEELEEKFDNNGNTDADFHWEAARREKTNKNADS